MEKLIFIENAGVSKQFPIDERFWKWFIDNYLDEKPRFRCVEKDSISMLYVDEEDYLRVLNSRIIGKSNIGKYISWVDAEGVIQPYDCTPIMQCVLPQTRQGIEVWADAVNNSFSIYPKDFEDYMLGLKDFCSSDLKVTFNEKENIFNVLLRIPRDAFGPFQFEYFSKMRNSMIKRCKGFNSIYGPTPFIEIYFPREDNSLPWTFKIAKAERTKKLESYFMNSLFHDIVRDPSGAHIAPHNVDYHFSMDAYSGDVALESDEIQLLPNNRVKIRGDFMLNDIKGGYSQCVVTDIGDYESELCLEEDSVSMTTTINVARTIKGQDFAGQNPRDAFFTCLSGDGSEGSITYTEHFVKIADGTRLLHYSDEYESFEIFDLPDNWFIDNGLSFETTGQPKVFDDTAFDENDKDLEEVRKIMQSRKQKRSDKIIEMKPIDSGK